VTIAAVAQQRPDAWFVGVDVAHHMLRIAQRQLSAYRPAVALIRADAAALPFADASFDAITGHSFLYLLPDPAAVLAEARRVVRPGGMVMFMEPSARYVSPKQLVEYSHHVRFLLSVILWRPMSRLHRRYTDADLTAALTSAGFIGPVTRPVLGGLGVCARATRPADVAG